MIPAPPDSHGIAVLVLTAQDPLAIQAGVVPPPSWGRPGPPRVDAERLFIRAPSDSLMGALIDSTSLANITATIEQVAQVIGEERPDVDQVYMDAVQAMTGRGGWPMTVFLTPDGRPFFAGTYFPKARRHGLPAFTDLCRRGADFYNERRDELEQQNRSLVDFMASMNQAPADSGAELNAMPLDVARQQLEKQFDATHGGFGGASSPASAASAAGRPASRSQRSIGGGGSWRVAPGDPVCTIFRIVASLDSFFGKDSLPWAKTPSLMSGESFLHSVIHVC